MSEVGDATQIIVVAGKGAYFLGKITLKAALQIIRLFNTMYLGKWKGKTRLGRLRQIKGDDLMYLNVGSEMKRDLKDVQKEMKKHGILFARMPDLCGGDGRTQYAIAASDAPKVRALLINHSQGKYRNIQIGMISEKDYLSTGFTKNGTETREMFDMMHDQTSRERKSRSLNPFDHTDPARDQAADMKRNPDLQPSGRAGRRKVQPDRGQQTWERGGIGGPVYGFSEPQQGWGPGKQWTYRPSDDYGEYSHARRADDGSSEVHDPFQHGGHQDSGLKYGTPESQLRAVQEAFSDVQTRMHDLNAQGLQSAYQWIAGAPVDMEKDFAEYSIDDSHSVFIPVEDAVLPGRGIAAAGIGAALFRDRSYTVVNLQDMSFHSVTGKDVIERFREALLSQTAGSRTRTADRTIDRHPARSLAKSTLKPAEPQGVILNGIPDAKSLDSPPVKSR